MPKFTFRYETLLRHRRTIEDRCQRELATRVRTRMILTDQLAGMQQDITRSKGDLGDALVGRVDLSRVGEFTRFNAQATVRGRQMVGRLAELEQQVESARQTLLQATRQRKALDVLRERDLAEWKREQARRETAELDEIAGQAYTRRLLDDQRVRKAGAA
jgi:flagellar FliJ protein